MIGNPKQMGHAG